MPRALAREQLIEHVAKSLYEADLDDSIKSRGIPYADRETLLAAKPWDKQPDRTRRYWREMAEVALHAYPLGVTVTEQRDAPSTVEVTWNGRVQFRGYQGIPVLDPVTLAALKDRQRDPMARPTKEWRFTAYYDDVLLDSGEHTCGAGGDGYGHEPHCGLEQFIDSVGSNEKAQEIAREMNWLLSFVFDTSEVHWVENGGMLHAVVDITRVGGTTEDRALVTCKTCKQILMKREGVGRPVVV